MREQTPPKTPEPVKLRPLSLPHSQVPTAHNVKDKIVMGTWLSERRAGTNTHINASAVITRCLSIGD